MRPDEPLLCRSEGSITVLTYQKLKCRLYRIIGPFLGRRKESSDSRSLTDVHQSLLNWYQNLPTALSCEVERATFESRPEAVQLQALALQLAYDNLQIVLHRQTAFAAKADEIILVDRRQSIDQLLLSASRTAKAATFKVAEEIARSSHAAMHLGICLFTAGVVLCALNTSTHLNNDINEHLKGVDQILQFFQNFPGQQYGLVGQSYEILVTLRSRCSGQPDPKIPAENDPGSLS